MDEQKCEMISVGTDMVCRSRKAKAVAGKLTIKIPLDQERQPLGLNERVMPRFDKLKTFYFNSILGRQHK